MWRCSNCGTGIEDKYAHCWQCGAANAVKRTRETSLPAQDSVPGFASYEELAKIPPKPMWIMRRGPLQRVAIYVVAIILFKIFTSRFMGSYGLYIFVGAALIALVAILWGFFRRDPNEGVGIKLN